MSERFAVLSNSTLMFLMELKMDNQPRIVPIPMHQLKQLAALIAELDEKTSDNQHPQYKELVEEMHNTLSESMGVHKRCIYSEPIKNEINPAMFSGLQ
jgi:hypothetical protein